MAHERQRYQFAPLVGMLKASPVVGLFGHRQVGKTTLIQSLPNRTYTTLDLESNLRSVENDPMTFVSQSSQNPMTVDESQFSPALFPAIKERVRKDKRPGQFLLSGSVRFLARKTIRESLTGRILLTELLPFNMTELESAPPQFAPIDWLVQAHWGRAIETSAAQYTLRALKGRSRSFAHYLLTGGLPGLAFTRNAQIRKAGFDSLIDTLLERDLRMIYPSSLSRSTLIIVLRELARMQGVPLEIATLSRQTRVSAVTLRRLLSAFESLFVIRRLETKGGARAPVIFFEDQGEATALNDVTLLSGTRTELSPIDITRGLFANLRPMLQQAIHHRRAASFELFQYRTINGSEVPLVLRMDRKFLGFIPLPAAEVTRSALGAAQSIKKSLPGVKVLFLTHQETKPQIISADLAMVPVGLIL